MIPIAQPLVGEDEKQAVNEVIDSGMLAQGQKVAEFEARFAEYCGVEHAVATTSGTTALHLALLANGIGPGDEVIVPPFTFIASVNAILYTGATPVFVDVDVDTFVLDVEQIESAITSRTKAILPVHLYGLPLDMPRVVSIAEQQGLAIIEDAAQAHGAAVGQKRVGSFGTGCFSFYPTKNVTAGEGGMITTDDEGLATECRILRAHGSRERYAHERIGYNFRMTDIQGAIGLAQIRKLGAFNHRRHRHAAYLSSHLEGVITPTVPHGRLHAYNQYTIRVDSGQRDHIVNELRRRGVGAEVYYPIPAYGQAYHQSVIENVSPLPGTEQVCGEVLSLPVHPGLSQDDLTTIATTTNDIVANLRPRAKRTPSGRTDMPLPSDVSFAIRRTKHRPLRVGVVGIGSMGANHARVYTQIRDVELVGVADPNIEVGGKISDQFQVPHYVHPDELLGQVDAVSIAVPTSHHEDVALPFLHSGVHCLIEKPIAIDEEGARKIGEAAAAGNCLVQVGHIERFNPAVQELSNLLNGEHIYGIDIKRLSSDSRRVSDVDVILDLMIHDVDIVQSLMNDVPVSIQASGTSADTAGVDYCVATLTFANGTIANLTASRITEDKIGSLSVTAREMHVSMDFMNREIFVHRRSHIHLQPNSPIRLEATTEKIFVPQVEPLFAEHDIAGDLALDSITSRPA